MENIILLFLCLLLGVFLQKVKQFPANAHQSLNQFVIYVSLPALALYYIPKITLSLSLLYPLGIAWLGFGLSFVFFYALGTYLKWSKKLIGCLILTSGLGNTSFVGFPIIEALYGSEGLKTAIIVDQPGSFVVVTTLGILVAASFSRGNLSASEIAIKIIKFPPFIAFTIALLCTFFSFEFPNALQNAFLRIGNTVTPVALVAVGLQIKVDTKSRHWSFLTLGLFFKLFIMPAFFFLFYRIILGAKGLNIDVSIMESAMAPMITGVILASNYGLKPKLSSMMVGIGIPVSLITTAIWYFILK
ncbi:MAG: AEC family transporter [Flavobacteriaceae bacterium]|nr:AEC family transporter [Flavobacteriaceae bacterium]